MRLIFISVLFICVCLMQISCGDDCSKIGCESPHGVVKLKFFKDGKNALFGQDSISHDSIRFYVTITDTSAYNFDVPYNKATQTMDVDLTEGIKYLIEFKPFRRDTYEINAIQTGMTDCCKLYELSGAKKNGQVICVNGCHEIVEVQL